MDESIPLITPETVSSGRKVRKPSRIRRVALMVACLIMQFISVGTGYGLSVMYVEIIDVFMTSRSLAALVQSVYLGIMLVAGIFLVWLVDKIGTGGCVLIGTLTSFVGLVASALSFNVTMVIIFAGFITGLGMSLTYLNSFVTVSLAFKEDAKVPLVFLMAGSSVGMFVYPYIFEVLISEYLWNGAFLILGAIALNMAVCGVFILCSKEYLQKDDVTSRDKKPKCDVSVLRDPVLLVITFCNLLLAITGPIESWFLVDIMVIRGFGRASGSFFVSVAGMANLAGRLTAVLIRTFCSVPSVYHWTYINVGIGLGHAFVLYLTDYWSMFGGVVLYGVALGVMQALTSTLIYETVGSSRYSQAIAFLNVSSGVGNFVGGLAGGSIKDLTGSYDLAFQLAIGSCAFVIVAMTIMMTYLRCTGSERYQTSNTLVKDIEVPEPETILRNDHGYANNNTLKDENRYQNGLANRKSDPTYGLVH